MKQTRARILILFTIALSVALGLSAPAGAQEGGSNAPANAPRSLTPAAVPDGTRFLVRLTGALNTGRDQVNDAFRVRTLESLETISGHLLPAGTEIRGHISRIEPAHIMGRARIWLTFDDIRTRDGWMPIIAEVIGVPGDFAVKQRESREGEIEARSSGGTQLAQAAAGGAAVGGMSGAATHGPKGAAIGAATGGVAAFLMASGLGQEIDLPANTKLELILDRPLYIAKR